MKLKFIAIRLIAAGVLGAGGYGLYHLGINKGMDRVGNNAATAGFDPDAARMAGHVDASTGKKVLYWHDPMVPGQKFDKPGKSPFMDMMLVPVYADGDADQGQVAVSPRMQQDLGVRTAAVARTTMAMHVEAAGTIAFNERDQALVQARATGYIERLYVRATLDRVAKGQPLVDLYVPDWVAAQEEFLSVRRMQGTDLAVLVDGARQRMRQVGMTDDQIGLVEASGKVQPRITLAAPVGGVVVELMAREGMTVTAGATLFRINGLSTVWANAEVPESQASLLRVGSAVEARSPALPDTVFKGKVQAILPDVNPSTRTLKARVELVNSAPDPSKQLAPGMFVSVALSTPTGPGLTVPTEAIIQTGTRAVVMLVDSNGGFRPVDVETGMESGGRTEIKRGLIEGQKVVASGQFLVDSEANLKATTGRMGGVSPAADIAGAEHVGEGKIEAVGKNAVTLSHGPIPSMHWGAMTMDFGAPATGLPPSLKPAQMVTFAFTMNRDGRPVLTRIEPTDKPMAASAMESKP